MQLPDATSEPEIRVLPEAGITTVLGSDYTGEAKKSFLRLFMRRAKQQGGLGLHAGSKRITVAGSEGGGLYMKTFGLAADEQPELHAAATDESAVLENVAVDDDGTVHFDEPRHGRNARAVIRRDQLARSSKDIDLPQVGPVFFITRNPMMPTL